jgi:hypothetical protein
LTTAEKTAADAAAAAKTAANTAMYIGGALAILTALAGAAIVYKELR